MAKGVKTIKPARQYFYPRMSAPGKSYTIEADKTAPFSIEEWTPETTDDDKKHNITWLVQTSDRKHIITSKTIPGTNPFPFKIPANLCGSYYYYIEASLNGKRDLKNKTGVYVKGYCKPCIVSSKWALNKNGAPLNNKEKNNRGVCYGETIHLHAETEGLNGDVVTVEIYNEKVLRHTERAKVIDGAFHLEIKDTKHWWFTALKKASLNDEYYFKLKDKYGNYVSNKERNWLDHGLYLNIKNQFKPTFPTPPTNQTATKVGESKKNIQRYELCKYEKIIIHDKDSNKNAFDIIVFDPKKQKNVTTYETLAKSNEDKNTIDITFEKITNKACFTKKHKKEIEIYIDGQKQKSEALNGDRFTLPIQATANTILLRTNPELFFVTPDKPKHYAIIAKTCAQPNNQLNINVYPKVEREVAFVLSLIQGYNKETNVKEVKRVDGGTNRIGKRDVLTGYSGEKGMQLIDGQLEILEQKKGGLGFGLQAKVKVDNTVSSIELGKTKNQIKELIGFYHAIVDLTKDFDGRGRETESLAYRKGSYPKATFDIEAPNIALAVRMTNTKVTNTNQVATEYSGGIALKPITSIKIGVDLISLIPYFGLQGKIANAILEFCTEQADIEVYVIFEISFQARAEFNLAYNEIEGLKAGKQKLEIEALATGKIGVKSRRQVTLTIVTSDGTTDKAKVDKFKGEGSIAAGLLYSYDISADKKGMYSQHKLEFTGLKASIVVYSIGERMKRSTYFKKDFTLIEKPDEPWYKSNKDYF